jgi:opacity protein-like surface antigen
VPRRLILLAVLAVVFAVFTQAASADPVNAKKSDVFTALCGGTQLMVSVNGNGEFTPAHVIGSTAMFIPTAFNLTFSFTPTGGTTQSETDTAAKAHQPKNAVTCELPAALNTFTSPEGTFVLSGTVTGFFTPAR